MKKLILIFLCLLIATPGYAKVLKYRVSDGEALAMGDFNDMEAPPGTRVVYVDFGIPDDPIQNYNFDGDKLVRKSQIEIDNKIEAKKNKRRAAIAKIKAKTGLTDEELIMMGFTDTVNR